MCADGEDQRAGGDLRVRKGGSEAGIRGELGEGSDMAEGHEPGAIGVDLESAGEISLLEGQAGGIGCEGHMEAVPDGVCAEVREGIPRGFGGNQGQPMRVVEAGLREGGVVPGLGEPAIRERGGIRQVSGIERRRATLPLSVTGGEGEHQNCGSKPEKQVRWAAAKRGYFTGFWGIQAASRDSVSP